MTRALTNSIRDRALELLGDNIEPSVVASALGVTPSDISQYLADETFRDEVTKLRYERLVGNNSRDRRLDAMEDKLLDKIDKSLGMIFDPMKLVQIYAKVNAATRRGASAPASLQTQQPAVALSMPTFVLQKFTTQVNIHNQVVAVQDSSGKAESLVTIQSKVLRDIVDTEQSTKALSFERNQSDASSLSQTPARVGQTP